MRCLVEVAPILAEPAEAAAQVTQALRGELLEAGERREGYVRVTTAYGYPGWMLEAELCGDEPLELARGFLGSPYAWGGLSAAGIDCSGLVHIAYRLVGKVVPRDSWQQEEAGRPVDSPAPGDLLTYGEGRADHIAFWVGEGLILHATARDGLGVVEELEPSELRERRRLAIRL